MKQVDYKLFFSVLFLVIFGMIMISSVSVYSSFRVTDIMAKRGFIEEAYNHFYVLRNISHVIISMIILGIVVKVPYKFFEKYSKYFFLVTIVGLVVVLLVGTSLNGARGWISIPGIPFTIQPTEFLKFTLIIYLAYFFKRYKAKLHTFSDGFLPFVLILSGLIFLIGSQPDFGTIMVIIPISFIMFFMAGGNVRYLITFMVLGMMLSSSVYFAGKYDKTIPEDRNKLSYITDRIDNFLADPEEIIKNKTINYQTEQALIAIGSGGFNGLGFGKSIQKFGYLPEVQGDFIFSVIVEELGFIGALGILSLYLYIGSRGLYIYRHVKDLFAKYVAIGVSSWILMQAFINIGVNLNIVPLTGITLPFVSYGGSSLLSLSLGLALLLAISRNIEHDTHAYRKDRKKTSKLHKKISMKLTPAMQQYYDIKEQYKDAILFFRMGDFYEMFAEDANIAHRVLSIAVTSRNKNAAEPIPLAGIPYHAKEKYLPLLVGAGYKVAIAEQVSDPKLKGIVKREVVRVVTPATLDLEGEGYANIQSSNYLVSVVFQNDIYGLSFLDITTNSWICSEFADFDSLASEVYKISPSEVILSKNLFDDEQIKNIFSKKYSLNIYFFELQDKPAKVLKEHFGVKNLQGFGIENKPGAQTAAAQVIGYLKMNQKSDLGFLDSLSYESFSDFLDLDETTIRSLDLIYNMSTKSAKLGTLFGVLDDTKTSMGTRYLRDQILYPLQDIKEIKKRQSYIEEFYKNPVLLDRVQQKLKRVSDIDAILNRLALGRAGVKDLTHLKKSLQAIQEVIALIQSDGSKKLQEIFNTQL